MSKQNNLLGSSLQFSFGFSNDFVSVAEPDPGSRMGKKSRSGVNILDHISESLKAIIWV
jgi:hypothetical protein